MKYFVGPVLFWKVFYLTHPPATHKKLKLIFLCSAGPLHKPIIGIIVGIVVGLVVVISLGGALFFWCKGYKREVFVDVAGLSSFFSVYNVLV